MRKGWNAVFLGVDPVDPAPGVVFGNLPVEKAAAFFPGRTPVEYIQDPSSATWKQTGWRAWYAPSQPEAPLSDLAAVLGGQAYLVYASAPAVWRVDGQLKLRRFRWRADSYNLIGFPVDPASPPTLGRWFAGSPAHQSTRRPLIYTLDAEGHWAPVDRTETTVIQPHAAYWVFCQGGSDYQGPLDVSVPRGVPGLGLEYGSETEVLSIEFRNRTGSPLGFVVEMAPPGALPLSYERRVGGSNDRVREPLTEAWNFGPLAPGEGMPLRITLDRSALSGAASGWLRVRDDVGGRVLIPVTGRVP